jgi:hypothetical protein
MEQAFSYSAKSFTVGSTMIEPLPKGATVIVGPNNSGKTRAIFEVAQNLKNRAMPRLVADNILDQRGGSTDDLLTWLQANYDSRMGNVEHNSDPQFTGIGDQGMHVEDLSRIWESADQLGPLGNLLIVEEPVETRLSHYNDPDERPYDPRKERPRTISHALLRDTQLEQQVFEQTARLYGGKGLTVGRSTLGRIVELFGAGILEAKGAPNDEWEVTTDYQMLNSQGSGVRAGTMIVNLLAVTKAPVLVIDEPELFLHPPLAYQIGGLLGEFSRTHQVLTATHSASFLNGLIASGAPISIQRFTKHRATDVISVKALDPIMVRRLWNDPRMHYTGIADGLFHDAVVLCENNRDCMFYAAALDAHYLKTGQQRPELLFIDCSGKTGMHKFAAPLMEIGVPVIFIVDIDYVTPQPDQRSDASYLKAIASQFGINWETLLANLNGVRKEEITELKHSGLDALEETLRGQVENSIDLLRAKGIFVLKTGELESFGAGPANKEQWIDKAMTDRLFESDAAQALASDVATYLESEVLA